MLGRSYPAIRLRARKGVRARCDTLGAAHSVLGLAWSGWFREGTVAMGCVLAGAQYWFDDLGGALRAVVLLFILSLSANEAAAQSMRIQTRERTHKRR